jgi:hypothetical protein
MPKSEPGLYQPHETGKMARVFARNGLQVDGTKTLNPVKETNKEEYDE